MGLGAREVVTFFALTTICGSEDGSSGASGDETELGADAGEEWSGVQNVGVGGRRGETGSERSWAGVGEDAGIGLGGDGDRVGRGGTCRGGKRRRTSSIPTPLSNSTWQRLFAAFLIRFAGGGGRVGGDSGGDG
jgi:hypothetical protein